MTTTTQDRHMKGYWNRLIVSGQLNRLLRPERLRSTVRMQQGGKRESR